jgi:hypothetical protein
MKSPHSKFPKYVKLRPVPHLRTRVPLIFNKLIKGMLNKADTVFQN